MKKPEDPSDGTDRNNLKNNVASTYKDSFNSLNKAREARDKAIKEAIGELIKDDVFESTPEPEDELDRKLNLGPNLSELDSVKYHLNDAFSREWGLEIIEKFKDRIPPQSYSEIQRLEEEWKKINNRIVSAGSTEKTQERKKETKAEPSDTVNQSTQIWELIREGYFFADPTENTCYVDFGIPVDIGSEDFLDSLTNRFYAVEEKLPSPEALNSVRRMARFTAKQNIRDVHPRTSRAGDSFIFDPIKSDGSVYVITKEGVNPWTPKKPRTIRFKGMLKAEVEGGGTIYDLSTILGLWNLTDEQVILLIGDIGASFVAGIPQAILVLTGEQGAGKTTLTRALKEIVDPNAAAITSLRADQEANLVLAMLHQRVTAFDNVNGIMPQWVSDILCSAATGNGFRTRQLYTNSGEFVAQIQRKIIVNGINESNYNGDFQERSLHLHLSEIDAKRRIPDKVIKKQLSDLIPRVRGFFLNKMSEAINLYEEVAKELDGKLPRMADYTIWGECFVRAMGFESGSFLKAFQNAQDMDVMENSADDITVKAIYDLVLSTDKGIWA